MKTQSEQTFYQNATSNPLLVKKFVRNNEKTNLAQNPNTSINILQELSKDEDYNVREGVAQNPNTPIEILIALSKDKDWRVRRDITWHKNILVETLVTLSKDEHWSVRGGVAHNQKTPSDILLTLSKDEHDWSRWGVVNNPNSPNEAIIILINDEDVSIKKAALSRQKKIIKEETTNNTNAFLTSKACSLYLDSLLKEKGYDKDSGIGKELVTLYNETQAKLQSDLDELKAKVVDLAINDFTDIHS